MKPHSVPVEVTKVEILTGMVRMLVVSWSEIRNSVQEKMKHSTAVAARPPLTSGSTTRAKHLQAAGAVDGRRLVELHRHVVEEALHQQHGERQVDQRVRQDQAEMGVAQTEIAEDEEQRNCHRDRRHHALREHEEQEVLLRAEAEPRQAVGGERGEDQRQGGRRRRRRSGCRGSRASNCRRSRRRRCRRPPDADLDPRSAEQRHPVVVERRREVDIDRGRVEDRRVGLDRGQRPPGQREHEDQHDQPGQDVAQHADAAGPARSQPHLASRMNSVRDVEHDQRDQAERGGIGKIRRRRRPARHRS